MNSDRTTIGHPTGLRIGSGSGSYERTYERTDVEVGSGCLLTLGRTRRGGSGIWPRPGWFGVASGKPQRLPPTTRHRHTQTTTTPGEPMSNATDTFAIPCLTCGATERVIAGEFQPHDCAPPDTTQGLIARAYWAGFDHALEASR